MYTVQFMMKEIQCKRTTELGHDEVYYMPPACYYTPNGGVISQIMPVPPPGPNAGQYGNADGPSGAHDTAWDCNDSAPQNDLTFGGNGVGLFEVNKFNSPGDLVTITLILMESDGWSYTDVVDAAAKIAEGILTAAGDKSASGIVKVVDEVIDVFKGLLTNTDDYLGTVTAALAFDDKGMVRLVNQGVTAADGTASIYSTAAPDQPAEFVAHTEHDRGVYDWTIAVSGARMPA